MADSVLFTCVGTTDPVRGYRDGGMLHIMRHYRPKKVYIFLSEEMGCYEEKDGDHRYTKTIQYAKENWQHYDVSVDYTFSHIVNVQDLDEVAEPLQACFERVLQENPDSEILVNLSSGTPQMKTILDLLTLKNYYRPVKGIQVSNPDKKSGGSERNNGKYYVKEELECNEDEEPEAPNRCTEPKLYAIERDRTRAQVRKLIEQRDYRALEAIGSQLPPAILPIVKHLAARNDLQTEEAIKLSKALKQTTGLNLYPHKGNLNSSKGKEYILISDYYLLMRNLEETKHYSEFVLRINPFLTFLLQLILKDCLPDHAKDIIETGRDGKTRLLGSRIRELMPDIAKQLETQCRFTIDDREFAMRLGVPFLRIVGQGKVPDWMMDTFVACEQLNAKERNRLAHQLHAVTDDDIAANCTANGKSYNAKQLIQYFGKILDFMYHEYCDKALFEVYDRCNEYMLKQI